MQTEGQDICLMNHSIKNVLEQISLAPSPSGSFSTLLKVTEMTRESGLLSVRKGLKEKILEKLRRSLFHEWCSSHAKGLFLIWRKTPFSWISLHYLTRYMGRWLHFCQTCCLHLNLDPAVHKIIHRYQKEILLTYIADKSHLGPSLIEKEIYFILLIKWKSVSL